jgi:hypothetical protein
MAAQDSLLSLLDYEYLPFCVTDLVLIYESAGHFFSFPYPLVNTPQMNNKLLNCLPHSLPDESLEFMN